MERGALAQKRVKTTDLEAVMVFLLNSNANNTVSQFIVYVWLKLDFKIHVNILVQLKSRKAVFFQSPNKIPR